MDTPTSEISIELAFLPHNHGCQWTVKNSDQHTQHQSGDFHEHRVKSLSTALGSHNQWKNLVGAAKAALNARLRMLELRLTYLP